MALPTWTGRFTRQRRLIQLGFFAVFALLPLLDLFRFDFIASRLYFFRQEYWLDEWTLIWLALMLAMWVIGAATLILGRVYCAYACPQMVFSEYAHDLDALGRKLVQRLPQPKRARAARAISLSLLLPVAVLFSILLMGYFAPLPQVLLRLTHLDVGPWVGAIGAITAILFFLDFALLREGFCRAVCPYGLLQGILEDGRSLHVEFDETSGQCIQCRLCEKVCPMEIDIRKGPFQIECTRCGSCIDACAQILGKRKRPSLLAFSFGSLAPREWDAKRVLVAVSTLGFAVALAVAVLTREAISFRLSPVYTETTAAATAPADVAETSFLLRATNKGKAPVTVAVRPEGLPPGATVGGLADPGVPAGTEKRFTLVVRVPRAELKSSVVPFILIVRAADRSERFPAALFVADRNRKSPPAGTGGNPASPASPPAENRSSTS